MYDALRPFARFMTAAEHEELVRGIILENRLRKRIAQLQEYRAAGVRTLAEAQDYEVSKRKKEQSLNMKRQSAAFVYDMPLSDSLSNSRSARYAQRARGVGEDAGADAAGASSLASSSGAAGGANGASGAGRKRRREDAALASGPTSAAARIAHGEPMASPTHSKAMSLEGVPGVERLSAEERRLCEYLHLLPAQYFIIKATIINLALVRGHVRRGEATDSLVHVGTCSCARATGGSTPLLLRAAHAHLAGCARPARSALLCVRVCVCGVQT
ncbi:hypothetical protein EON68_04770 [archaeon]|nr:MAG: hypothetical protein EON68_04770 [archaeon]